MDHDEHTIVKPINNTLFLPENVIWFEDAFLKMILQFDYTELYRRNEDCFYHHLSPIVLANNKEFDVNIYVYMCVCLFV